jgi:hypothetical protein
MASSSVATPASQRGDSRRPAGPAGLDGPAKSADPRPHPLPRRNPYRAAATSLTQTDAPQSRKSPRSRNDDVQIGAHWPCSVELGLSSVAVGAARHRLHEPARRKGWSVVAPHPAIDGAGSTDVPLGERASMSCASIPFDHVDASVNVLAHFTMFRELGPAESRYEMGPLGI